jgi:hypothetical protein
LSSLTVVFLSFACFAHAPELDLDGFDPAEGRALFGCPDGIESGAIEVADETAPSAHEVVVPDGVGVVAHGARGGADPLDEPQLGEDRQGPIDRVERDGRHPAPHPAIDRLDIGVCLTCGDLSGHFESLMSQA